MTRSRVQIPDAMPVLSRGRHRSPRRGACFMEYASVLAGERWSDHPACTHPAVASLARLVNDCVSDATRSRLVPLITSVVGMTGRGRITTLVVAVHAASAALPVANEASQRALAAGLIRCIDLLGGAEEGVARLGEAALEFSPAATRWAREFIAFGGSFPLRDVDRMCEAIIRTSVVGIADACIDDPDARLHALLVTVVHADGPAVEHADATADAPAERLLQSA